MRDRAWRLARCIAPALLLCLNACAMVGVSRLKPHDVVAVYGRCIEESVRSIKSVAEYGAGFLLFAVMVIVRYQKQHQSQLIKK